MRASKEQAERAIQVAKRIRSGQDVSITRMDELVNFLIVAKAKLPSEAAYDREKDRRKKGAA